MNRTMWMRLLIATAAFACIATGPAMSQLVPSATANAAAPLTEGTFAILVDDSQNQSINGFTSQDFTDAGGVNDASDSTAADDFLVPDGSLWDIFEIDVPGFFGAAAPGPVDTVDVTFYADGGGVPGAVQCAYDDLVPASQLAGALSISLPTACTLSSGIAWLSVQAAAPAVPNGQWFWFMSTVQEDQGFAWQNPGDGFLTGCTTFMTAAVSCGATDPDLAFVLRGTDRVDIPTLGGWGLLFLAIGLAGLSLAVLRRRTA